MYLLEFLQGIYIFLSCKFQFLGVIFQTLQSFFIFFFRKRDSLNEFKQEEVCRQNELELTEKSRNRPQDIKVSIIMATWNRGFIIKRAIDSVLKQDYRNWELIISDDGSNDNTEEIIKGNYADEKRILYHKNEHRNVGYARNKGLQRATGELIAYLDSDNEWYENYLLLMVNTFNEYPDTNTLYCGIKIVDKIKNKEFIKLRKRYCRISLLWKNYIDLNIFMHRRILYEQLKGFNEDLTRLVDWELILRYTRQNKPLVLECILATYYYENNFNQISGNVDLYKNWKKVKKLQKENEECKDNIFPL